MRELASLRQTLAARALPARGVRARGIPDALVATVAKLVRGLAAAWRAIGALARAP